MNSTGQNPGLAAMWFEEQMRRDEPFPIALSMKDSLDRNYKPLDIENDFLQVRAVYCMYGVERNGHLYIRYLTLNFLGWDGNFETSGVLLAMAM